MGRRFLVSLKYSVVLFVSIQLNGRRIYTFVFLVFCRENYLEDTCIIQMCTASVYTNACTASVYTNACTASVYTNDCNASVYTNDCTASVYTNDRNASVYTNDCTASVYTDDRYVTWNQGTLYLVFK